VCVCVCVCLRVRVRVPVRCEVRHRVSLARKMKGVAIEVDGE